MPVVVVVACVIVDAVHADDAPSILPPPRGLHVQAASSTHTLAFAPAAGAMAQVDVVASTGSILSIAALASGSAPMSYRWYQNGVLLAGSTGPSLDLVNISSRMAGRYVVEISNGAGSIRSAPVQVSVRAMPGSVRKAPDIVVQPASQMAYPGEETAFFVSATGTAPLSYQWFRNGAAISGATSDKLRVPGVTFADAGTYTVEVRNSAGSEVSNPATLRVEGGSGVVLRWNTSRDPNVAGYHIYSSSSASEAPTRVRTTHNRFFVGGLTPGGSYSFRIASVSSAGIESPLSAPVTFRAPTGTLLEANIIILPVVSSGATTITVEDTRPAETRTPSPWATSETSFTTVSNATEILFQEDDGYLASWMVQSAHMISSGYLVPNRVGGLGSRVAGRSDFDRDGHRDLLIRNGDRRLGIWFMDGNSLVRGALLNTAPLESGWEVGAIIDLNRDGHPDLVLQHSDGSLAVWYLQGLNVLSSESLNPSHPGDPDARLVAAGPFGLERRPGLVFQNALGEIAVWSMNGHTAASASFLNPRGPANARWRVRRTADLDNDGHTDLILQDEENGSMAVWFLQGLNLREWSWFNPAQPGGTWKVIP